MTWVIPRYNCLRRAKFEAGDYDNALLLVDGGYALTSYMMPPLEIRKS